MSGNQNFQKLLPSRRKLSRIGSWLKRDSIIAASEYIVRFLLALLLSRAKIFGDIAPFAASLVAAAPMGKRGSVTFAGAIVGYLISGNLIWGLKYVSISVLIYSVQIIFRGTEVSKKVWFAPVAASFMTFCIALVYTADAGFTLSRSSLFVTEVVLAGGAVYFYKIALSPWKRENGSEIFHSISILILAASLFSALSGIHIFNFIGVGRFISVIAVMLLAFKGGIGTGAVIGLLLGLSMDSAAGISPFFSFVYAASALTAALVARHGRTAFTITFILTHAAAVFWAWNSDIGAAVLYECFIASVVFMILPASFMAKIAALIPSEKDGYGILKAREYAKERVEKTAEAFSMLYDTVKHSKKAETNDSDTAIVFDMAAENVCRTCSKSADCWQTNYQNTLNVMNDITPSMLENGSVTEEEFPAFFSSGCNHFSELVSAINDEVKGLLYRRQYQSRLRENQGIAYQQYADISSVLNGLASELGEDIKFEPELESKLQKYLRSMNIESATAVFRDKGGRLHIEITSTSLYLLKNEEAWLDKLSAVMDSRLCWVEDNSNSGHIVLLEAEPLSATVGIASMKKHGTRASGDKGLYFKTDEGMLYVLLSDGMGSGVAAQKSSSNAATILERFLRAGVAPETSLKILNDLMLLKNETDTDCPSIDLMCLNLFSGETRIFKYGAAPSYVRKGAIVRSVRSRTLASGLEPTGEGAPEFIKMKLEPNSIAIIASDGVTSGGDIWLREMLASYDGCGAKELARKIVCTAAEKFGTDDDMTVLTVCTAVRE